MKKSYVAGCAVAAGLFLLSGANANAQTAPLDVPAKAIQVPSTVSPQLQKIIGAPLRSNWDIQPKTGEEWKPVAEAGLGWTFSKTS